MMNKQTRKNPNTHTGAWYATETYKDDAEAHAKRLRLEGWRRVQVVPMPSKSCFVVRYMA